MFILIGAGGILLISISRASLEMMTKEEREGKLRTEPVIIDNVEIYKLPQSTVLPDNKYYWLKEVRDWTWQKFSFGEENKIQIWLILADKKVSEARVLMGRGKYDLAFKSYQKAIDQLKYANSLVYKIENKDIVKNQMINQIRKITEVYKKMIEEIGKNDKIDEQKYLLLLQKINEFEEKQI
ncbi:MAG TPA: DUF5667 domain-containing protein [Patescibacteria group bacterium]